MAPTIVTVDPVAAYSGTSADVSPAVDWFANPPGCWYTQDG